MYTTFPYTPFSHIYVYVRFYIRLQITHTSIFMNDRISYSPGWPQILYVVGVDLNKFSCLDLPNLGLQVCAIMLWFKALYQSELQPESRQIRFINGRLATLLKGETEPLRKASVASFSFWCKLLSVL